MPGETCVGPQPDGSCLEIYIPACVDRTIYCEPLPPFPSNATVLILNEPVPGSFKMSTVALLGNGGRGSQ